MNRDQIIEQARRDVQDARRIVVFSLGRLRYAVLAIPVVLIAIIAYLVTIGILPGGSMQPPAEAAAIVVLTIALIVAFWRWRQGREPYFLWLSFLIAAFIAREIHLKGTTPACFIAIVLVFYVGLRRYALMAEYFASRTVVTLFILVLFTYALTEALDAHFLAFLPHEKVFERPTEEVVEVFGHLTLLLMVLVSRKGTEPLDLNAA
jgi:hypothetical protein